MSAFVTFVTLVLPYLRRRQGIADVLPEAIAMRADFAWGRPDSRREFLRAKWNAQGGLELFPQGRVLSRHEGLRASERWGLVGPTPRAAR